MSIDIKGYLAPGFEPVGEAFAAQFDDPAEIGAAFAFSIGGETVVDIFAGHREAKRQTLWTADTLVPVFSTGKAVTALVIAWLVGEGRLSYADRVAEHWPEFAAAGKGAITVEQALSHQAGLSGVPDEMDPGEWFDRDAIEARLAAQAPLWPFDGSSGYHPISFGVIADAIVRRTDAEGRTIGAILREVIAGPAGAEVHVGLPESEHHRAADHRLPPQPPDLGEIDALKRTAFLEKWSTPGRRGAAAWRAAELPAANAHASASGLARLMEGFACNGVIAGREIVDPDAVAAAMAVRTAGPDRVMPFNLAFGAGVIINRDSGAFGPEPAAVGHYGFGGSCAFADPVRGIAAAYTPNRMLDTLFGDERAVALIEAAYAAA